MTVGRIPNVEGGIQPTLLTTTGDIMYASSASNPARLGIGSSAQVLTVASGVPSWATPAAAGGMTLLSTTTLSGASTTISSISGIYNNLFAVIFGVTNATADGAFQIAPNALTTISTSQTTSTSTSVTASTNGYVLLNSATYLPLRTSTTNVWKLEIYNYASTTGLKAYSVNGGFDQSGTNRGFFATGFINTTSAITSLVFNNAGGNLSTGTVLLYGVK
jgi:hypothetical protein